MAGMLGLRDVYAEMEGYRFTHDGVLERCSICHILQDAAGGSRLWELGPFSPQKRQVFFLYGLSMDRSYDVELSIDGVPSGAAAFTFRPYDVAVRGNDHRPPRIDNVRVAGLRAAVFYEATIRWETDEPALSIVEYGRASGYGERVVSSGVYRTDHSVKIGGLGVGVYHYRIIARDVFGNAAVSDDLTFDTASHYNENSDSTATSKRTSSSARPAFELYRIDSTADTYIEVRADTPVDLHLKVSEGVGIGKHGMGLAPARLSHIAACRLCHLPVTLSHPVGIRSGDNTAVAVPTGLPTIEGGVVTCVTCHGPHGGDEIYYSRLDIEGDPCGACHKKEETVMQ